MLFEWYIRILFIQIFTVTVSRILSTEITTISANVVRQQDNSKTTKYIDNVNCIIVRHISMSIGWTLDNI